MTETKQRIKEKEKIRILNIIKEYEDSLKESAINCSYYGTEKILEELKQEIENE